jgi:hypothetical protein
MYKHILIPTHGSELPRPGVATEYARSQGVAASTRHVFEEHPYKAIIDAASKNRCDLIFMASHGRKGVKRPGSQQRDRQGLHALQVFRAGLPLRQELRRNHP